MLGEQAQPDQTAPVLADDGDAAQVQHVEGERAHPLDVPRVAVVAGFGGLVGAPEADEVGGDRAQPGVGEHGHHRPVEERPGGLAVQQQDGRPFDGPVRDPRDAHAAAVGIGDVGVLGGVGEVGEIVEPLVGGAEGAHPAILAAGPTSAR
jgi:hypothetical protein